jgi:transcriptional regulator of acetoin/glycerol metabolism
VIRDTDIDFLHANAASEALAPSRLPTLREAEQTHIRRALELTNWNKKEAARILEISRGTLYRKIVEYGLEPNAKGSRAG